MGNFAENLNLGNRFRPPPGFTKNGMKVEIEISPHP